MSQDRPLHSYDADEKRSRLLTHLGEVLAYPALAWRNRSLISNFLKRDLQGRFRGSALGMFWVLVHPLFLFVTYWLVFGLMFDVRGLPGLGELWYPIYLFSGILVWTVFTDITIRGTSLVVENGNLIKKVAFPAQILPVPLALVDAIVYGVGLLVLLAVMAFGASQGLYEMGGFGPGLLAMPLVLLDLFLFAVGMALLLASLHVFARDVNQIFPILANLWFFASPVFWHDAMFVHVDEHGQTVNRLEALMPFLRANPLHPILQANRAALGIVIDGRHVPTVGEVFGLALTALIPAVATFAVGFLVFRTLQRRFADEV